LRRGVLNVSKVGHALFGDGVLADVANLDNFLGRAGAVNARK